MAAFHHITELEAHGINRNDVQRLSEAGYCTVESVSDDRTALEIDFVESCSTDHELGSIHFHF